MWLEGGSAGRGKMYPYLASGDYRKKEDKVGVETVRDVGPEFPFLGFYFTSSYESVRHLYAVDPMLKGDSATELRGQHSNKI